MGAKNNKYQSSAKGLHKKMGRGFFFHLAKIVDSGGFSEVKADDEDFFRIETLEETIYSDRDSGLIPNETELRRPLKEREVLKSIEIGHNPELEVQRVEIEENDLKKDVSCDEKNKTEVKIGTLIGVFAKLSFLRPIAVSVLVFLISFLVLNWPAYSQIFSNWLDDFRGDSTIGITKIFNRPKISPKDLLKVIDASAKQNNGIPILGIEVSPPDNRIILPAINKNVPIVEVGIDDLNGDDWEELENRILQDLQRGVVRFPGTARPGQKGNVVLTGHSSYYFWDKGEYKDVFALLPNLKIGDQIVLFYNQQKYKYVVSERKEVLPTQVDVLNQTDDDRLTLITCTPVGTNLRRLILTAKQI